jgi:hypothetical protein
LKKAARSSEAAVKKSNDGRLSQTGHHQAVRCIEQTMCHDYQIISGAAILPEAGSPPPLLV